MNPPTAPHTQKVTAGSLAGSSHRPFGMEPPAAPAPAGSELPLAIPPSPEAWAMLISKLEQFKRDLVAQLREPAFIDRVVKSILASDVLNEQIQSRAIQTEERLKMMFNHLIVKSEDRIMQTVRQTLSGAAPETPVRTSETGEPKILGFKAKIAIPEGQPSDFKVIYHDENHPENPGVYALYRLEGQEEGHPHFHRVGPSEMVVEAIRQAYAEGGGAPNVTYALELWAVTDRPLSETDSVQVNSSTGEVPTPVFEAMAMMMTGGGKDGEMQTGLPASSRPASGPDDLP